MRETLPATGAAAIAAAPGLAPVAGAERLAWIDALRGFALLGVLLVNMGMYGAPIESYFAGVHPWPGTLDRAVEIAIVFFCQGKFYPLLSILFGLGFAMQLERAASRGADPVRLLVRRMLGLLAIGLVHAYLVWYGDILVTYSAVGLLLIPFRRRATGALAAWIPLLLVVPVLLLSLAVVADADPDGARAEQIEAIERAREAYGGSDLARLSAQRASDVATIWTISVASAPGFLGLFLIGLLLGRCRVQDDPARLPGIRRWILALLAVGGTANAVMTLAYEWPTGGEGSSAVALAGAAAQAVAGPALALCYAAGIALAFRHRRGRRLLGRLAPVGRMALSNYLAQSLVCTTLFYGYGLGLYGRVSPAVGLALSLAIFAVEIPASAWWLRRFRFGPAEWLWRSMTYGRPQPWRP